MNILSFLNHVLFPPDSIASQGREVSVDGSEGPSSSVIVESFRSHNFTAPNKHERLTEFVKGGHCSFFLPRDFRILGWEKTNGSINPAVMGIPSIGEVDFVAAYLPTPSIIGGDAIVGAPAFGAHTVTAHNLLCDRVENTFPGSNEVYGFTLPENEIFEDPNTPLCQLTFVRWHILTRVMDLVSVSGAHFVLAPMAGRKHVLMPVSEYPILAGLGVTDGEKTNILRPLGPQNPSAVVNGNQLYTSPWLIYAGNPMKATFMTDSGENEIWAMAETIVVEGRGNGISPFLCNPSTLDESIFGNLSTAGSIAPPVVTVVRGAEV